MKLVKSLLMASVGLTILGSQVSAADYFVQPLTPGPVANTPVASISLQATTPTDESAPSAEQSTLTEPAVIPPATGAGETATGTAEAVEKNKEPRKLSVSAGAKWVRARSTPESSGATAETTTTTSVATSTESGSTTVKSSSSSETAASTDSSVRAAETTTVTTTTEGAATTTSEETASTTTEGTAPTTTTTSEGTEPTTATSEGTAPPTTTTEGGTTTTPVVTPPPPTGTTTTAPTTTALSGPAPVLTASQTYKSIGALLQTGKVKGGDRIFLLGGYHGPMALAGLQFTSPVIITSMPGQTAHVDSINIRSSKKIVINNLKVWPSSTANGLVAQVRSYNDSSELVFSDLDVRAAANSTNYKQWTITDWNNNQRSGFLIDGPRQTVMRNRLTGVYNGIFVLGQNALVEENIIDGFAGDALRALGDNSVIRRNKAQNCHQTNGTHTDGFQSFSRGPTGKVGTGVVRGVVIDSNKFLEFVGTRSTIACKLQGIGLFDGMFDGFVIRNNLISSTAYHGITIGGGLNSTITNNTVIHAMGNTGNWPWLRVSNHKDGTPSKNVTVANNLVSSLKVTTDPALGILQTNNIVTTNPWGEFNAINQQDFTLKSTSKAIDKGTPTLAPALDIEKAARPKGKAPDAGAYESY